MTSLLLLTLLTGLSLQEEMFQCSQGLASNKPYDYMDKHFEANNMSTPCKCGGGWESEFCGNTTVYSKEAATTQHTPIVCVCREFTEESLACDQFMMRCYKKQAGGCRCCFMQDEDHCDTVPCENDHPVYDNVNTTCSCFPRPVDYPVHICEAAKRARKEMQRDNYHIDLLGVRVHALLLLVAVAAVIILVGCVTLYCLATSGTRKVKKAAVELETRIALASKEDTAEQILPDP